MLLIRNAWTDLKAYFKIKDQVLDSAFSISSNLAAQLNSLRVSFVLHICASK